MWSKLTTSVWLRGKDLLKPSKLKPSSKFSSWFPLIPNPSHPHSHFSCFSVFFFSWFFYTIFEDTRIYSSLVHKTAFRDIHSVSYERLLIYQLFFARHWLQLSPFSPELHDFHFSFSKVLCSIFKILFPFCCFFLDRKFHRWNSWHRTFDLVNTLARPSQMSLNENCDLVKMR